jgi:hypothetical protein
MNKEPEEEKLEEPQVAYSFSTQHEHYYEDCGVNAMGLREVICKCGHGMQVTVAWKAIDGILKYNGDSIPGYKRIIE